MAIVEYPSVALDRVISFGDHSYSYYVRSGPDTWSELVQRLAALHADRFVLVTDASFPYALACDAVARITALCPCTLHTFAPGERAKNLLTVEALAQEALAAGVTRSSCIIGLGGGLAGNVAGLLAALLFRGIRLVHIPTTLLAMSDSVLSLKQAVNTRLGKNHLGTYYAPQWVWNDLGYLRSLPTIEIQAALCELIKNVLTICPQHYERVASLLNPAACYTEEQYVQFIELCVTAKCAVMRDDPQEKREALVLEYGHTVGHALELLAQEVLPAGTLRRPAMNQLCAYGPITNDTKLLGITRQLIGGKGVCFWKQLINGMHLDGHLHCVEYVVVPPGASIGMHTHDRAEEIYYILSGHATMDIDGSLREVAAGDLIATPLGASHAIANLTDQFLTFFVLEVFPSHIGTPREVAHIPLRSYLLERIAAQEAKEGVFSASIDLAQYFTGNWAEFMVAHIPPGGQLGPYRREGRDEVLFVVSGLAEITFGDESISGRAGLCIALPARMNSTVCNASLKEPLEVIRAEVYAGV